VLLGKSEDDAIRSTKQEDMKQIVKGLRTLLLKLIDTTAGTLTTSRKFQSTWEEKCRSILGVHPREVSLYTADIVSILIYHRAPLSNWMI
jgi:hypothetical protein